MNTQARPIPTQSLQPYAPGPARKTARGTTAELPDYGNLASILSDMRQNDAAFAQVMQVHHFDKGQLVATAEDLEQRMYVLMQGDVNLICTSANGRQLLVAHLEPGAIFGQGALSEPGDSTVFAKAANDVMVWSIPAAQARKVAIQYPILSWGLLQTDGERLSQVQDNLENLVCKKLPERLAGLLLQLSDFRNGMIEGYCHQNLADFLGTYRETVSAVLRNFKQRQLIKIGYRRIEILHVDRLKEIAGVWT